MLDLAEFRATYRDPAELDQPAAIVRLGRRRPAVGRPAAEPGLLLHHVPAVRAARVCAAGRRVRRHTRRLCLAAQGVRRGRGAARRRRRRDAHPRGHRAAHVGDEPFTLAGHSGGALVANTLARYLREAGRAPEAVVLLDPYPPESEVMATWVLDLLDGMTDSATAFTPMDDFE